MGNHDVQCRGHGMDERIACCNHHHKKIHNWVNKVGTDCKSSCESNYALDNGSHLRGMKNEICGHNVVARLDDLKLTEDRVILFELTCARYQSPSRFEIQWQGYARNNQPI